MTGRPGRLFPSDGRFPAVGPTISRERRVAARRWAALASGCVAFTLSACTSSGPTGPTAITSTSTRTVVITHNATPTRPYTPPPASTVRPLAPGASAPAGEKKGHCPYIRAGLDVQPGPEPTVAGIEGDRVGRITLLTGYRPVGCRFYFSYPDHEAIADILPTTFGTAERARNAMIRTAQAGRSVQTYPDFAGGVTGISYRTRFFAPDGTDDWAFVFAKAKVMVVVHTQQTRSSSNARYLAAALVPKF